MNCIIIEDDELSIRIIEEFVNRTAGLNLLYSFTNAIDAINTIRTGDDIHLILLDIELPEMSGMEFLDSLTNPPLVIIISSKDKYALDAFEYNVVDYLLKPLSYARFYKAIEKARKIYQRDVIDKIGKEEIFIKNNSMLV